MVCKLTSSECPGVACMGIAICRVVTTSVDGSCSSSGGITTSLGSGGAVDGPASVDEEAAVLAGVVVELGPVAPEPEEDDEFVVTVVSGVISPGECVGLWCEARNWDPEPSGVCTGLWLLDVCVDEWWRSGIRYRWCCSSMHTA